MIHEVIKPRQISLLSFTSDAQVFFIATWLRLWS